MLFNIKYQVIYGNPRPPFNMLICVTIASIITLMLTPMLVFGTLEAGAFSEWYGRNFNILSVLMVPIHLGGWAYIIFNFAFHELERDADTRNSNF